MSARLLAQRMASLVQPSLPIGVDFDGDRIAFAQLERGRAGLRLRDACSIRHGHEPEALFGDPEPLAELVQRVLGQGRFQGRRIVTHAPSEHLRLMVVNYEEDPSESEPAQVLRHAQERMQDDLGDYVVDYLRIRTSGDQRGDRSAMVAVAPEKPVIERLEALRHAGLKVVALEIAPVAIRRLMVSALPEAGVDPLAQIALVIRIRRKHSELALLSGRRLLLHREIEVGTETFCAAIAKSFDCEESAAEDLLKSYGVGGYGDPENRRGARALDLGGVESLAADEVDLASGIEDSLREIVRPALKTLVEQAHKAVSYAAFQTHGMGVDTVQLIETAGSCRGLDGLLAEMLKLPVALFDPALAVAPAKGMPIGLDHRHALALGFALRGMVDE